MGKTDEALSCCFTSVGARGDTSGVNGAGTAADTALCPFGIGATGGGGEVVTGGGGEVVTGGGGAGVAAGEGGGVGSGARVPAGVATGSAGAACVTAAGWLSAGCAWRESSGIGGRSALLRLVKASGGSLSPKDSKCASVASLCLLA